MKRSIFKLLGMFALFALILLTGCFTSSRSVIRYSELSEARIKHEPLRILTVDTTIYTFSSFTFTDSTISGIGMRNRVGKSEDFNGSLKFSDIVFVERLQVNGWKAIWMIPMAIAGTVGAASLLDASEFVIERPAGSCPFVYSFDGSDYTMDAETFSTAISKALESETYHVLPSLSAYENVLKVRISNERPETHLFNSIKLYAVDAENASKVVLDTDNIARSITTTISPDFAFDHTGSDILKAIIERDGRYWQTDLKALPADGPFRDKLELQFEFPENQAEAILIVDAINSELINEVYGVAGAIVGDEALEFYRNLEEDTDVQLYFKDWIRKSSLLIEVNGKNGWREVGAMAPEANMIPYTRAIRIEVPPGVGNRLAVRLSSMTDVWRIDAVAVSTSGSEPLEMHPLNLLSVESTNGIAGVEEAIAQNDTAYTLILPPDYMDLAFDATSTHDMRQPAYILSAKGYLYEWFPNTRNSITSSLPAWFKELDRKEMLKYFIRKEDLFLNEIYSRWVHANH